jgi:hypothetical protein
MANGQLLQMLLRKGMTPEMLKARPVSGQPFQDRQKALRQLGQAGGKPGSAGLMGIEREKKAGIMEKRQQSKAQPGVARPPQAPKSPVSPFARAPGARALVQKGLKRRKGEL